MPEITNQKQLRVWLKDKPESWSQVIAIRIAMRLIPLFVNYGANNSLNNYLLTAFRAVLISFTAKAWPSTDLRGAATSASIAFFSAEGLASNIDTYSRSGRNDLRATSAAQWSFRGPLLALFTASEDDVDMAAGVANSASEAMEIFLANYPNINSFSVWRAIEADVNFFQESIEQQFPNPEQKLLFQQLWSEKFDASSEISTWNNNKNTLSNSKLHWDVWTRWYERRINGNESLFGLPLLNDKSFAIEIAQESDAFWSREADVINQEIQSRLEAAGAQALYDELKLPEIPDQKSAPLMTFERDGRIAKSPVLSPSPTDSSRYGRRRSGHAALLDALDDFGATHNCQNHPGFLLALRRIKSAFGSRFEEFDIIRAGSVALRIQENAMRADQIFMPETAVDVVALNTNIQLFINQFDEWDAYVSDAARDSESDVTTKRLELSTSQAMLENEALEPETSQALEELIEAVSDASIISSANDVLIWKGLNRGLSNVLVTASESAIAEKRNYLLDIKNASYDGHIEGVKEGSKQLTTNMMVGLGELLLLLSKAAIRWSWLRPVLEMLKG